MQNAMSQPLIVSVPHRLGRQEARRRLDRGIGRLQPELSILLSGLNYHWQGDTLYFTASAMWQQVTGRIEVLDDAVRVEIDLPWVMRLLHETIAKRVRGRGVALLAKPPDEV
jgi:Putative polyhydroxyalkanoic acid system protein (PHA_gran_rgn)